MATKAEAKGFRLPVQTVLLDYQGGTWEGAEVRLRKTISLDAYFYYGELDTATLQDTDALKAALHKFGDEVLDSWNIIGADGKPLPASGDGILALEDIGFALDLIQRWRGAVTGADAPLADASPNGKPSEVPKSRTGRRSKSRKKS